VTLSGLVEGQHELTFYASDIIGNFGASELVYFTIAKPEFFPTMPVITASAVVVAIAGVSLLVYLKKRRRGLVAV
jgi:hypothetical protein